jgi:hypothetical protein
VGLAFAPGAGAEQLPTAAQAKAVRTAFARNHHGDLIQVIKVSTREGTWAKVESLGKQGGGGKAREAKGKIINVAPADYRVSHGKAKQVPAKQVPKPAAKDLAKHLVLTITIEGHGEENGTETGLESDGCTIADATLTSALAFTFSARYDLDDQPDRVALGRVESANSVVYEYTVDNSTNGTITDVYKLTETSGSGSGCTPGPAQVTTCNGTWKVGYPVSPNNSFGREIQSTEFFTSGASLIVPNYETVQKECTINGQPSQATDDVYTARWPNSLSFSVPIHIAPGNVDTSTSAWNVGFPADVVPKGQQETVTDPSQCQLGPALSGCSDMLTWHAKVDLDVSS